MAKSEIESLRKYGYDILINRFEPQFRKILINEVLLLNYGLKNWTDGIPDGVKNDTREEKDIDINNSNIEDFFEELYLLNLKDIAIYKDNFQYLNDFLGNINKTIFIELMDELNEIRRKIAHSKSTFTNLDLVRLIDIVKTISQGSLAEEIIKFIDNENYKNANEIPVDFFKEYEYPNNLPIEDYDLDGGFVGRRDEIKKIKNLLYSQQDRILTITGAGGIGKTAVALKTVYNIISDNNNPFDAFIWFSAKEQRLTHDSGIITIESQITTYEKLVKDILNIVDNKSFNVFEKNKIPSDKYKQRLYELFSSQPCLIIIDNLETIRDEKTIDFIKNIPRPSQVLITSRKGLGEIERRFPLPDFSEKDAITLFRLISRERDRKDLLKLKDKRIIKFVRNVKCYPLLIKWSIGKICLGAEIKDAFSDIYSGESEIAKFSFNDIFVMLSESSKLILYSMIIFGDNPIGKPMLKHMTGLDDSKFEDSIRELTLTSFVIPDVSEYNTEVETKYTMLSLTRGFISSKLDENKKTFTALQTKYYDLTKQIQELEKSKSAYYQSLFTLGIKTENEKIAFNYIKTAKIYLTKKDFEKAKENFENAIDVAPEFGYALIEYAKFEFSIDHIHESNKLFEDAIKFDKENFHAFYSYGICLRKQSNLYKSLDMLNQASILNPDYIPIFYELGRVLSFMGNYEKADSQFEQSLQDQKYPNYKYLSKIYYFKADNYLRWSEDFFDRKDNINSLEKLKQAKSTIEKAIKINKNDLYFLLLEKKICRCNAIQLCKIHKFEEALPYFEICFKKIQFQDGSNFINDPEMAKAYYYFVYYGFKLASWHKEQIKQYIKIGKAMVRDNQFLQKYGELELKFEEKFGIKPFELHLGTIVWYNKNKNYGLINSENKNYTFVLRNFNKKITESEKSKLEGANVSFSTAEHPEKKGEEIAININLE